MSTRKQTEPIVDYALRHRVPFAVVPCCVFMRALGGHRVLGATHTAEEAGAAGGESGAVGGGLAVEKGGDGGRARDGSGSGDQGNAGAGSGGETGSKEGGDAGGKAGDEEGAIVGVSADPSRLVSTYEDYLDYLQGKDPRIRRSFLNFRGRNVVLSLFDYG